MLHKPILNGFSEVPRIIGSAWWMNNDMQWEIQLISFKGISGLWLTNLKLADPHAAGLTWMRGTMSLIDDDKLVRFAELG